MLENYADQREVVLLFSLLFFTLLQRARRSRVIFLQRLITRRAQRRRQAALLRVFTAFALQERRPRRIAWVLPRPQYWFDNLLNSNALNMWWKENFRVFYKGNIPFYLHCCCSCYPATRYYTSSSHTGRN